MPIDPGYVERNRASSSHIRALAARLSDEELLTSVGEHWTVAVVFVHLAFWDRRLLYVLDKTEENGKLFVPNVDMVVNDLSLPIWKAVDPRAAARIAFETGEAVDKRLEHFPPALLEQVYAHSERWVERSIHRETHLEEAEAALRARTS